MLVYKTNIFFDEAKAKDRYLSSLETLGDVNSFDTLLKGDFWNIHEDGDYLGSIFTYLCKDGKLWLGGYSVRKRYKSIMKSIKEVLQFYKEVNAYTTQRHVKILLLKMGFKKDKDNMKWIKKNE